MFASSANMQGWFYGCEDTHIFSWPSIPFVDVMVSLNDGIYLPQISTPNPQTNISTRLLRSSPPPPPPPLHTKRAISFNLALRLRRICSSDDTFNLRSNKLNMQYLMQQTWLQSLFPQTRNTTYSRHTTQYRPSANSANTSSRVPFVVTYNLALRSFPSIKALSHSPSSQRCTQIFTLPTFIKNFPLLVSDVLQPPRGDIYLSNPYYLYLPTHKHNLLKYDTNAELTASHAIT